MKIAVAKSERGWELTWAYNDGLAAFGHPEDSPVYPTRRDAEHAASVARAEASAWDRAGLADAPHKLGEE